jgi:hypothetical protein
VRVGAFPEDVAGRSRSYTNGGTNVHPFVRPEQELLSIGITVVWSGEAKTTENRAGSVRPAMGDPFLGA